MPKQKGIINRQSISPLPPQPYIKVMRTIQPAELPYLGAVEDGDIVIVTTNKGNLTGYVFVKDFQKGTTAGVESWNGMTGEVVAGLQDLNNVVADNPDFGDTIVFDGEKWVNAQGGSGTGLLSQVNLTLKPLEIPTSQVTSWLSSLQGMLPNEPNDELVDVLALNSGADANTGVMNLIVAEKQQYGRVYILKANIDGDEYIEKRPLAYADGDVMIGSYIFTSRDPSNPVESVYMGNLNLITLEAKQIRMSATTDFVIGDIASVRPVTFAPRGTDPNEIATIGDISGGGGGYPNLTSSGTGINTKLLYTGTGGMQFDTGSLQVNSPDTSVFAVRPTTADESPPLPNELIKFQDMLNQLVMYVTKEGLIETLLEYAKLNSPAFTGKPTSATMNLPITDNSTAITNTNWVVRYVTDILLEYAKKQDIEIDLSELKALIATKAPIISPLFEGNPRAPTPKWGDSSNSIATTDFVNGIFDPDLQLLLYPNGLCIQTGFTQLSTGYSSIITLAKQFTKGFVVLTGLNTSSVGVNQPVGGGFTSTDYTQIEIKNANQSGVGVWWCAIGYVDPKRPIGVDFTAFENPPTASSNYGSAIDGFIYLTARRSSFEGSTKLLNNNNVGGVFKGNNEILYGDNGTRSVNNGSTFSSIGVGNFDRGNYSGTAVVYLEKFFDNPSASHISWRSTDGFQTYTTFNFASIGLGYVPSFILYIGEYDGKKIWWAGGQQRQTKKTVISIDDGVTFSLMTANQDVVPYPGTGDNNIIVKHNGNVFNLFSFGDTWDPPKRIAVSSDGGQTWNNVSTNPFTYNSSGWAAMAKVLINDQTYFIASTKNELVYLFNEDFSIGELINLNRTILSIIQYNNNIYAITGVNLGILVSNNGKDWFQTNITTGSVNYARNGFFIEEKTNMLVANLTNGVYYLGGV